MLIGIYFFKNIYLIILNITNLILFYFKRNFVISGLTIGLMKDMGYWAFVNEAFIEFTEWGNKRGCDFLTNSMCPLG